ncbi:MAG: hypothetical protein JSU65_06495 [Candidatus Zixiibacteriota bacterium]|nr:MAG: hypothetical protein JSU65_06495 [candidate division Zixibacteria bacterium]
MNRMYPIAVLVTIGMSICLATAQSESKGESERQKKVEDNFKVSWTRISYDKTASVRSTFVPEDQRQEVSESLSLQCEVDMLDPNLVLGTSMFAVIEEMTDDKGEDIAVYSRLPSPLRVCYQAPRYGWKYVGSTRTPKWKNVVRSVLRLPPKADLYPQWAEEIQASPMVIGLDVDSTSRAAREISRAKGRFYALAAESFEYVDVPFKKSDKWVRLTPEVEVQVVEAWCKDSSYRIRTKGRPRGGGSMPPVTPESHLPARFLVRRQLIGPDGKPVGRHGVVGYLPYRVGGGRSDKGNNMGQIKKIRYVIAVNPTHYEIPFVLEHIPLPEP